MIKILCDFQNTIGGAPRSHLIHAQVLRELGYEIVAVISKESKEDFFDNTDFKVYHLPEFKKHKIFRNLWLFKKYSDIIARENISLIYANRGEQCQFLSILSDLIGIPILNARAGGLVSDEGVKLLHLQRHKNYIVYSDENYSSFIDAGFATKNLTVIRNRLNELSLAEDEKSFDKIIQVTLTGSIKDDTFNGIIWLIDFLKNNKFNNKVVLNIAGGNILKDPNYAFIFEDLILSSDREKTDYIQIIHHGWVDDINKLQRFAHICIGKGRSIIEPAMMGKICFVISEDGDIYRVKNDTYADLQFYNFSGRGKIQQSTDSKIELLNILNQSFEHIKSYHQEAHDLAYRFRKDYGVSELPIKLNSVIKVMLSEEQRKDIYLGLKSLIMIYMQTLLKKIGIK